MKKLLISLCILPTLICSIMFSNCCVQSSREKTYGLSQEQFIKQSSLMYEKNLVDFFPSDWRKPSTGSKWGAFYSSPWDDSDESIFRCCAYFSSIVSTLTMDSLVSGNYLASIEYCEKTFSIDVPYMKHAESYRNHMNDSLLLPVANMRYSFWGLGEAVDTIVIGGRIFEVESEIIPKDLVLYVQEASAGNFWKNKEKSVLEARPVLSEHWKHGYVKGFAVSRELSRVCWWVIAW